MLIRILALILVVSCSTTKPTPYKKEHKKEGYYDSTFEELRVARFKANSYTKKAKAELFAEFRAIENCRAENKRANIIDIFDKTEEKVVTRTSGTNWGPSYGFGSYPYYSRYPGFGYGVGIDMSTSSGTIWNERVAYPNLEVYYECRDKIFRPQILFKEIDAEQMKLLVKDLKGSLQVERLPDTSPNSKKIEVGDIILKANGKRIEKIYELVRLFDTADSAVTLSILREGRPIMAKITAVEVTGEVDKAEQEIITKVCSKKKDEEQVLLKSSPLCK